MGKPREFMVHELTDGTFVTAQDVANTLNCAITTARCRLSRSKDPAIIYKPVMKASALAKGKFKSYTLDDGSVWTVPEIAQHTGLTKNAIAVRLHKSNKAAVVLKTRTQSKDLKVARVPKEIKSRMFYDPDGFWKLFNRLA